MANPQESQYFFDFSGGWNTEASPLNIPPNDALEIENIRINPERGVSFRRGVDVLGASSSGTLWHSNSSNAHGGVTIKRWTTADAHYMVVGWGTTLTVHSFSGVGELQDLDAPLATFQMNNLFPIMILKERENLIIINNGVHWLSKFPGYEPYHPGVVYSKQGDFVLERIPVTWRDNTNQPEDMFSTYYTNGIDNATGYGRTYIPIKSHYVLPGNKFARTANEHDAIGGSRTPSSYTLAGDANVNEYWEIYDNHAHDLGTSPSGLKGPPEEGTWINSNIVGMSETPQGRSTGRIVAGGSVSNRSSGAIVGATYGGRAWYSSIEHPGKVFFSQTITHPKQIGRCWSLADPRNPFDPAIVDTDGGVLYINGAGHIKGFAEYKSGLMVFASNGIWYIRGLAPGEMFQTTAYSIEQVWNQVVEGFDAIISTGDVVTFAGAGAIYAITAGQTEEYRITKISTKIETYVRGIDTSEFRRMRMFYDAIAKKLYILHNQFTQTWMAAYYGELYPIFGVYYRVLVFDMEKGAWYLYVLPNETTAATPGLTSIVSGLGYNTTNRDVVDALGNLVVTSASKQVVAFANTDTNDYEYNVFIIGAKRSGGAWYISAGRLASDTNVDWASSPGDETEYDGNLVTAYQSFGDLMHKKQAPYISFLMGRVETGEYSDDDTPTNPGGLLCAVDWNWARAASSPYYGTLRQIYFPERMTTGPINGSDPGVPVVYWKQRLRGLGRALTLRFKNDGAKAFTLLGWQLPVEASRRMQ